LNQKCNSQYKDFNNQNLRVVGTVVLLVVLVVVVVCGTPVI